MAGILAAGAASALGNTLGWVADQFAAQEQRGWRTQSDYEDYRADYEKAISDYFLDKQMAYNTQMSNTAYQRAVADMEAAGINPAAMAGVSSQPASSPNAAGVSHSGVRTNAQMVNSHLDLGLSQLANSAIYSAIAKDHDAARLMANEIVDNAQHAHRLEELREKHVMNKELQNDKIIARFDEIDKKLRYDKDEKQSRISKNLDLSDYYYQRAREVEERRWKKR